MPMVPKIEEEGLRFAVPKGVFFNIEMSLCRSMGSLCIGSIGEKMAVLDAMCASGARGIRYKKENKNVASLSLSDMSKKAVLCARKNASANHVRCRVLCEDANRHMRDNEYDFIELDPFGSPSPFLYDAARSFRTKDRGFLSMTATDMAVLCGAHPSACLKNYGAMPLDNEFCHENAARILIGKTIFTCAQFNLSATPIFTLSHRHYLKIVVEIRRGADGAVKSVKSLGYLSYCPSCCWRGARRLLLWEKCPHCGHVLEYAGPLFLGKLMDDAVLEKMLLLNAKRGYDKRAMIEKLLRAMRLENGIDAYGYYDLHKIAKKFHTVIKSMDAALDSIRKGGFSAERTHFCPTAIRTDAPHEKVLGILAK